MKMIKPVEIRPADVQSDAPGDGYAIWQTEGRNTLEGMTDIEIAVADGEIWVIEVGLNSRNEPVYRFDLATGESLPIPGEQVVADGMDISVSPNGLWLAIGRAQPESNWGVYVYEISSGTLLYSRLDTKVSLGPWSENSEALFISQVRDTTNFTGWVGVRTADWSERLGENHFSQASSVAGIANLSGVYGVVGTRIYYLWHIYTSGSSDRTYSFASFDPLPNSKEGGTLFESSEPYAGPRRSIYIPSRNEFLCYYGRTGRLEAIDLNFGVVGARPAGLESFGVESITLDPNGDVIIEVNAAPYYRKYAAATFNFIENLGGDYEAMTGVLLFDGDRVIAKARSGGGYKVLDTLSGQFLEQVNPTVSEGDIYTFDSQNFEALADTQDRPDQGATLDPPSWLKLGAINPLRMFDQSISSVTVSQDTLTVQVKTSSVPKAIGLFNVQAATIRVQLLDQNDVEQFDTGELDMVDNTSIQDLNAYFFDGVTLSPDFVYTALPPYLEATVIVTLTPINGQVSVGEMVVGDVHYLGDTEFGTGVGILDFSRKERDQFGNFQIVERNFSKRANYIVSTPTRLASSVQQMLAEYRAIPAVFIGAEERPETVVYGFYRSFDIVLEGPKFSSCNIEVEGLT